MKRFKLTLTTDEGVILEQWILTEDKDDTNTEVDFLLPLQKYAPSDLAAQINMAMRRRPRAELGQRGEIVDPGGS